MRGEVMNAGFSVELCDAGRGRNVWIGRERERGERQTDRQGERDGEGRVEIGEATHPQEGWTGSDTVLHLRGHEVTVCVCVCVCVCMCWMGVGGGYC